MISIATGMVAMSQTMKVGENSYDTEWNLFAGMFAPPCEVSGNPVEERDP